MPVDSGHGHSLLPVTDNGRGHGHTILVTGAGVRGHYPHGFCPLPSLLMGSEVSDGLLSLLFCLSFLFFPCEIIGRVHTGSQVAT